MKPILFRLSLSNNFGLDFIHIFLKTLFIKQITKVIGGIIVRNWDLGIKKSEAIHFLYKPYDIFRLRRPACVLFSSWYLNSHTWSCRLEDSFLLWKIFNLTFKTPFSINFNFATTELVIVNIFNIFNNSQYCFTLISKPIAIMRHRVLCSAERNDKISHWHFDIK